MLRDYAYTENWRLLEAALEQFIELPASLKLVQFVKISPDSFLWILSNGVTLYYLYAEDYIENLESVRAEIRPFMGKGAQLTFLPVKEPVAFEDSSPNKSAAMYRPPENEYEVSTFAGQSGHDFVFLLESSEDPNTVRDPARYKTVSYDEGDYTIPVTIGRDLLQLAETAARNDDYYGISAVESVLMQLDYLSVKDKTLDLEMLAKYVALLQDEVIGYGRKESAKKKQLQAQLYKALANEANAEIKAQRYAAKDAGDVVTLVTAMYVRKNDDMNEGTTIALVVDNEVVAYPMKHFLDEKLKAFFAKEPLVIHDREAIGLPESLDDYRLMHDTVNVRNVFRRELGYLDL